MHDLVLNDINRFELIDEDGRQYVSYEIKNVELSFQDDNKTLKIFLKKELKDE